MKIKLNKIVAILVSSLSLGSAALAADVTGDRLDIGSGNTLSGTGPTIAGGGTNTADANYAVVGGGLNNTNSSEYSFLGGGQSNTIVEWTHIVIAGGLNNFAGGPYSVIGGGKNNYGGDEGVTVGGGLDNIAQYLFATVGGGRGNNASGYASSIAGGFYNTASSDFASVLGGDSNIASAQGSAVGGGYTNTASSFASTVSGGVFNVASGFYSMIPGGAGALAENYGQHSHASGSFASNGDAQTSTFVARRTTGNSTPVGIFLDGNSQRLTVPEDSSFTYDVLVVGRNASGDSAHYQIRGGIENVNGTTALVGSPNVTVLGEDISGWDATVIADNTNDALVVQVTGDNSTIRWVATIRTVEVNFPAE